MSTSPALDATLHARLLDVDPPDARRFVHAEARRLEWAEHLGKEKRLFLNRP